MRLAAVGLLLAACGGGHAKARDAAVDARVDAHPDAPIDARPDAPIDAAPLAVFPVDCTKVSPVFMFYTVDGVNTTYYPAGSTTVTVGDVIEFKTSVTHDVAPGPGPSDPGLAVDFEESDGVCLQFTAVGDFNFHCSTHAFYGLVTVNAKM